MCNCYEEQLAKLKEQYGEVAGFERFWKDGIYICAWYKPMTKKGKPAKHASYVTIRPKYCPFCGEPYDKKNDA